jgi:hypothetical protein
MRRLAHSVAAELSDTSLAVLFPLLTVGGGGLLLYLAYRGIVHRHTLYLPVRMEHKPLRQGYWVTGRTAVVTGISHLLLALVVLAVMGPISAALVGLW